MNNIVKQFLLSPEYLYYEKQWLIEKILPFISEETLIFTYKAIDHLYPDINLSIKKEPLPSFLLVNGFFRLWAILVSDQFRNVIVLTTDSQYDKTKENHSNQILYTLTLLQNARDNMWKGSTCVIEPEPLTLMRIGRKRRAQGPTTPYYNDLKIFVGINPYNDIADILKEVRLIVEKHQNEIAEENPGFFKALRVKEESSKARGKQIFIDISFRALIVYELSHSMKLLEIEQNFFGMSQGRLAVSRDESIKKMVERSIEEAKNIINIVFSEEPLCES